MRNIMHMSQVDLLEPDVERSSTERVECSYFMIALINGEVAEYNYHYFPTFHVGVALDIQLCVSITKGTELLDLELTLVLIKHHYVISISGEANPIIVIGSKEDPSPIILPRL